MTTFNDLRTAMKKGSPSYPVVENPETFNSVMTCLNKRGDEKFDQTDLRKIVFAVGCLMCEMVKRTIGL